LRCGRKLFLRTFGGRRLAVEGWRGETREAELEDLSAADFLGPFAAELEDLPAADFLLPFAAEVEDLSAADFLVPFAERFPVAGVAWERAPTRGRSCVGRGWRLMAGPPRAT
jgi:hypothetical protein